MGDISKLIEEVHLRVPKDFKKMNIPQISNELRKTMEFERQTFQKIEDLEKNGVEQDIINYAKIICKNTIQREITQIQEIYLKKIDTEYLNSK
jgi:hypothetical protein